MNTLEYLGLDAEFKPELPGKPVHRSWGWTRIVFNYYASKMSKRIGRSRAGGLLDRFDFLSSSAIKARRNRISAIRLFVRKRTALNANS